jgi:hypothetical protein
MRNAYLVINAQYNKKALFPVYYTSSCPLKGTLSFLVIVRNFSPNLLIIKHILRSLLIISQERSI